LFTEAEKQHISQLGADAATVIFSAKEAGYKAIYPIGRQFIGFLEAEIQIHPQTQTFDIRYLGEHPPNMQLNEGKGFWREHNGQVMTLFVLP
jgi:4'-phosphopantetheinyl transferase EntD